jgi:hypothetical protein
LVRESLGKIKGNSIEREFEKVLGKITEKWAKLAPGCTVF